METPNSGLSFGLRCAIAVVVIVIVLFGATYALNHVVCQPLLDLARQAAR